VAVKKVLEPYLPVPRTVKKDGAYALDYARPKSIGRVKSFYGNFLVVVRALAYILNLGPSGIREIAEVAVLNANYIRKRLAPHYHLKYASPTLHECVFSDKIQKEYGVSNLDIAKRLIDHGLHPPTMSFPLIVHGALMIEPTETESKRDLDRFIDAMIAIAAEARDNPEVLHAAPHVTYVRRLDETLAARNPVLKWAGK
jgi:glycine dehydrogenase subunit 2